MVNKVILVGNVGQDPEIRNINNDTQVAKFTLATSESYKNKDGERITQTEWHNIVVWRGLSKVVEQYVKKGSLIYIEGKITNRSYEKDGQTRYFTEIVANELKLLGKRSEGESYQNNNVATSQNASHVNDANNYLTPDEGDDLPF